MKLRLTVNGTAFTARLEDNAAARTLASRLPASWTMKELNGNEKYVYLDQPFPAEPKRPAKIRAGDLMLYGNDCVVLFYKSFLTPFRYTPIGRVEDPSGLEAAAGRGSAKVTVEVIG